MLLRALNDIWTALRSFDDQALTFAFRAVLVYIAYTIIKNIVRKLRGKKCERLWQMLLHICHFGLLCVYLSYLISLTLSGREAGSRTNKVNLEIFGTWSAGRSLSTHALENVLLFIPFGLLVPLTGRFFKKWWNLVLISFMGSLFIETMQLATARGYFELDDIILNTLGAICGYAVFWLCYHSYIAFKHESNLPLSRNEQKLSRITLFIVQLLPVILCIFLIFGFGSDDADKSGELSRFVTEKFLYIINKVMGLEWTAEKIHNSVEDYEVYVRTGAHFAEFGLFSLFTFVFLYCRGIRNRTSSLITLAAAGIIAVGDEINQGFRDGRSRSLTDVCVDCIGALVILAIINIIFLLIRGYKRRQKALEEAGGPI
ncbi:MAG: VanZ family protein [Lachnospiraceae bacterium]|nr:VanZ family protein [Lachnospiraceae bacterium]